MRAPRWTAPLGLALVGAALAGAPALMRERGWAPLVALAGNGDPQRAVDRLEESLGTLGVVFGGGLRVDAPTQEFVDGLRASLGSFDLESFHALLPETDGDWRRVRIVGGRQGETYQVARAGAATPPAIDAAGPLGDEFGELLLQARTRPAPRQDRVNYVGALELGLGVGRVGWPQVMGALRESALLLASGDPAAKSSTRDRERRASAETRLAVLEAHPRLRAEDVEVAGLLWEAYPRSAAYLASISSLEDVLVFDPSGRSQVQQLRLRSRLVPEKLQARFPELAEFLGEIGPLFKGELLFRDARNQNLLRLLLDTEKLEVTVEGFLHEGRLVPIGPNGLPALDGPAGAAGVPVTFSALGTSVFNVNGIETKVRDLVLQSTYLERADGADLVTAITKPPVVSVSGSAYGILPTWAIDVVIPGNMEELTREFLTTACTGDDGRGVTLSLRSRQQGGPDGPATVQMAGSSEILNSLLVQLAARIANEKLLPSDEVRAELWTIFHEAHQAFVKDFQAFKEQVR